MRRLFIDGKIAEHVLIDGSDAHHLRNVLRCRLGQRLVVVGNECEVAEMSVSGLTAEGAVELKLENLLGQNTEADIELVLVQCLPKSDKMDYIVQKAVELGVTEICPIYSENCVVKYDAAKCQSRRQKWQKIALEAAKQSGRTAVPVVQPIVSLKELLQQPVPETTATFMCYEGEAGVGFRTVLQQKQADNYRVIIGPEGGFTPQEAARCRQSGAVTVSLGKRILRTETASLAALTIIMYEKGDLGGRG